MIKKLKEYNFKYSKSLLGFESLSVLITFSLSGYLYFGKNSLGLAVILLLVGISNLIYYASRISNNKIQLKINYQGITLKERFLSWNKIDDIQIDKVKTGKTSDNHARLTKKVDMVFRCRDKFNMMID